MFFVVLSVGLHLFGVLSVCWVLFFSVFRVLLESGFFVEFLLRAWGGGVPGFVPEVLVVVCLRL